MNRNDVYKIFENTGSVEAYVLYRELTHKDVCSATRSMIDERLSYEANTRYAGRREDVL